MSEPAATPAPAADPPAPTPVPAADPPAAPAGDPAPDPRWDPDAHDPARASATITKLRQAEKEGRTAARERDQLAARLKEIEDAEKTELEKAQARVTELEEKERAWEEERRAIGLRLAAHGLKDELGIADVDLALAALDSSAIEYDADARPVNLATQLAELLERKPLLKGTATPTGGGAAPNLNSGAGAQGGSPPALTADELAEAKRHGMTPERYAMAKSANGSIHEYIAQRQAAATT